MKCQKCGGESPAGAKYCESCGAVLEDCAQVENQAQTAYNSGVGIHDMYENALIKSVKSPVYLVALIIAVIGMVWSLFVGNLYADWLVRLGRMTYEFVNQIKVVTCVAVLIPWIVCIVGLIMLRVGVSKGDLSLMRSGLMTIKTITIIQLVLACILLVRLIFDVGIMLYAASDVSTAAEATRMALIAVLFIVVIFGAVIAVGIVSYVITFRSIGSAIAITRMEPGTPARIRRLPRWYGIFVIVMGVIGGMNIASILFGINLMSFSEEINRLPYTEK